MDIDFTTIENDWFDISALRGQCNQAHQEVTESHQKQDS
jgi:hypothetical protein